VAPHVAKYSPVRLSPTLVAMKASAERPGPVVAAGPASPSVLLVEDDQGIATQLVRGLLRDGYRVDHVTTGREALSWGEPDVITSYAKIPPATAGAPTAVGWPRHAIRAANSMPKPPTTTAGPPPSAPRRAQPRKGPQSRRRTALPLAGLPIRRAGRPAPLNGL
jgi:hypothetical protein